MRSVGHRQQPPVSNTPSGGLLAAGARFNETLAALAGAGSGGFVPKGVYRFRSHAEANEHQFDCLTRGMAQLAQERR